MRMHDETVTIRRASPAETPALERLALLHGADRPLAGPVLVAEAGGDLRAALALADRRAISDPFHATAHLVALLQTRAALLTAPRARRRRRNPLARRLQAPAALR